MLTNSVPILVLSSNTRREQGKKVQQVNIEAGKAVADVIRTCLGPRAMLKMLMDPMGGTVMTNDGNAILREITVEHPAAKSMIEIARTQDEEVGDGTTSVIILAGEMLFQATGSLEMQIHPTRIISAYREALEDALDYMKETCSMTVDTSNESEMIKIVKSCMGTKFINKWSEMACRIALEAVKRVTKVQDGRKEIDIKRYARIEKIPGGAIEDSEILNGVMFNKDPIHPRMRKKIKNPRILLLDCNLEYKKGESQTAIEFVKEMDMYRALKIEEEYIERICEDIIRMKPDVVITEKSVSDYAQHFLIKANITVIRRIRKPDQARLARACGATIVSRTEEIKEEDMGTEAGLFEVRTIGDEYFTYVTECKDPKACSIILRGASKDVLNELERNLLDAMNVARNVLLEEKLVAGGGAVEMSISSYLKQNAKNKPKILQIPYIAAANALEIIPKTLIQNCGGDVLRLITELRNKHTVDPEKNLYIGVDGNMGSLADMKKLEIVDPLQVKSQVIKTAIETAILLLRIDDIVSGTKKQSAIGDQTNQN